MSVRGLRGCMVGYGRLIGFVDFRTLLKKLDYFQQQKHKSLTNSYDAMGAVMQSIEHFNSEKASKSEAEVGEFFVKMLKVSASRDVIRRF